jgi:DNA-binding MarR family transcriptional regulator
MKTRTSMHLRDTLYLRPGFLLRRAHQISAAVFDNACAALGLTQAQYGALVVLATEPLIDQTRLARALGFDKVTVLRVLRGLEERGLVVRRASATSRKHLAIALTAAGQGLLKRAQAPVHAAYEQLMAPLNAQQRQQFIDLLQTLTEQLGDAAKAPFVPLATNA